MNIYLLVIHCLRIVCLIQQKINLINIEVQIVWKFFFKDLKEHANKFINYEKKEMIPLASEENKIRCRQKNVIYAKTDLVLMMKIKSIIKFSIIVTTQQNIQNLLMIFVI